MTNIAYQMFCNNYSVSFDKNKARSTILYYSYAKIEPQEMIQVDEKLFSRWNITIQYLIIFWLFI